MPDYSTAVIALALSSGDDALLRHSTELAKVLGTKKIVLVHITADEADVPEDLPGASNLLPKWEEVEKRLGVARQEILQSYPEVEVELDVRQGATSGALLKLVAEQSADLLCVGRHHEGVTEDDGLGPHAMRIVHKSQCSVFAVSTSRQPKYEKLLVPIDFSPHSRAALETALAISNKEGSEIEAHHVYDVPRGFERSGASFEEFAESLKKHAEKRWRNFKTDLEPDVDKVAIHYDLIPHADRGHSPGRYICQAARDSDADLIVCGSKGLSSLASLVVGSVTEYVLHHTSRPVLTIKQKGETMGILKALFGPEW